MVKQRILFNSISESKMGRYTLRIANYLKKYADIDSFFMEDYKKGIDYYRAHKIEPIEIRKLKKKFPLQQMTLDLYNKLDLDIDVILDNNYHRYQRFGIKTFYHSSDEDYYPIIIPLKDKRIFSYINYLISQKIRAFQYPRIVHATIYYVTGFLLSFLELFHENAWTSRLKYYLDDLNTIALYNKERGFTIIAKKALQYYFIYYSILKKVRPDFVLTYNGNWASQTPCAAACEKLGIPHYVTEGSSFLGYSHFDSEAVWFDGDINRKELHELTPEQDNKIDAWIEERVQKYKRGIASFIERDDENSKQEKPKKLIKNFIFLPLQILDDTNNIRYSPIFSNMVDYVKAVVNATPEGYSVLIKRHPWDIIWVDPAYINNLKEIKAFIKDKKNVYLVRNIDSHKFLEHASALVSINSTMLMENCYRAQAPMVIVGDMFIRGWGFTYDVKNREDLPVQIELAIKNGSTPEMKKKMKEWLYLYVFEHLVPGNYEPFIDGKQVFPEHYEPIAKRILEEMKSIEQRKQEGMPVRLPKLPVQRRCMIDRSQFPKIQLVPKNNQLIIKHTK